MAIAVAACLAGVGAALAASPPGSEAGTSAVIDASAIPEFLTLPFASTKDMHIQQSWFFTNGIHHEAIDYIKGTLDDDLTWKGFPVIAAAAGKACGQVVGKNGCADLPGIMGNRVLIKHRVNGKVYFTFYNHLRWIAGSIPLGSRNHTIHVARGQVIGFAGHSGDVPHLVHLHFQLLAAGLHPLDPYGIYGRRWKYPDPGSPNGKRAGADNYWASNPPKPPRLPRRAAPDAPVPIGPQRSTPAPSGGALVPLKVENRLD